MAAPSTDVFCHRPSFIALQSPPHLGCIWTSPGPSEWKSPPTSNASIIEQSRFPPRLNCYRPLSAARCPSHTGSDKKVMSLSSAHPTTSNWSNFNCGCGRSEESHLVSFACHISLLFLRAFDPRAMEKEGKGGFAAEFNSDNTI